MVKGRRARRRARAKRRPAGLPIRNPQIADTWVDETSEPPWPEVLDAIAALPVRVPQSPPPQPPAEPVADPPLPPELTYPRQVTTEELTGGRDDTTLTAELAAKLREIPECRHCGGRHARACPRVRRMSFHPTGTLASVEFWPQGKWSDDDIIWPEALYADE